MTRLCLRREAIRTEKWNEAWRKREVMVAIFDEVQLGPDAYSTPNLVFQNSDFDLKQWEVASAAMSEQPIPASKGKATPSFVRTEDVGPEALEANFGISQAEKLGDDNEGGGKEAPAVNKDGDLGVPRPQEPVIYVSFF